MGVSNYLPSSRLIQPGVCTSTTRPSSPFEGQAIFETDTDRLLIWNGSAWVGISKLDAFQIDASGRVTTPLQPAFRYHGFSINSSGMQGGTAPLNVGSGLTIGSGATYSRFTAPVSGTYLIGASILVDQNGGRVEISLRKNNSFTIDGYSYYSFNQYASGTNTFSNVSGSYPLYLTTGDYVDMYLASGTPWSDLARGDRMFFGYLIG